MLFNTLRFLLNCISGYKMAFKNESTFHFNGYCLNFYFISSDFSVRIFTVTRRSPELSCDFFSFEIFFFSAISHSKSKEPLLKCVQFKMQLFHFGLYFQTFSEAPPQRTFSVWCRCHYSYNQWN